MEMASKNILDIINIDIINININIQNKKFIVCLLLKTTAQEVKESIRETE